MQLRAANYQPQYNEAVGTTEPYRGTDHTVQRMIELMLGPRGEQSFKVQRHTQQIVVNVRPKDYVSEMVAVCRWWGNAGRYTRDPLHVELLRDPERLVDDANSGKLTTDCDDIALAIGTGCLVLGARVQIVTVGFGVRVPGTAKNHSHVFVRGQDPRSKIWWVLDPVAGRRTAGMLKRVKQYTIFEVGQ